MYLSAWTCFPVLHPREDCGQSCLSGYGVLPLSRFLAIVVCLLLGLGVAAPVQAGLLGYPSARLQPLHLRFGLAGDSFKTDLKNGNTVEATTGRALLTIALGLTSWSEVFVRFGQAEFNLDAATFGGGWGFAYGGGVRLRLLRFPYGEIGLTGQYLRFDSDDDNSAGVKVEGKWEEYDVAIGVGTRRFGAFQFYGGVAYHDNRVTLSLPDSRVKLKADIPARAFIGLHIYPLTDFPGGEFLVNFEARLIAETPQFTLGVQYQF